jgi:cation diffusion facilitator family transporter
VIRSALAWMGFLRDRGAAAGGRDHGRHGHSHGAGDDRGHVHGIVDPAIAATGKGLWAVKWSFVVLIATTLAQLAVVLVTGSVALIADTVHNFGDAATAIPLGIAFLFARRAASRRFNYGLGRIEDLAGMAVVGLILFSALYAAYESIDRLVHPRPVEMLGVLALAGVVGFLGNEAVAIFRIRVGREINSAALVADGYHARVDGFGSLAVVLGALGVALGYPLADPIVGLLISVMIFAIVWQAARAVFIRMLDGIEPDILAEIEHAAAHVPGIVAVADIKARWLGHRLRTEVDVAVDAALPVTAADGIARAFEAELKGHMPMLEAAHIRVRAA